MTLATAPRDLEGLAKIGRFNARVLAQEGGLFGNEETKAAFMQLSNEEQAAELLKMFQRLDKKSTGKPAAATTPARTPANGAPKTGKKPTADTEDPAAAAPRTPATGAPIAGEASAKLLKSIQNLEASYAGIAATLENLSQQSALQQNTIERSNHLQLLTMSVLLQIAEESMNAPQAQILQAAFDDVARLKRDIEPYLPDEALLANDDEETAAEGNE